MKSCKYCQGKCIRKGYYRGTQKYRCKQCDKYHRSVYQQKKYGKHNEQEVVVLNNEGVGISSMSRILRLPKSSVQMLIRRASERIQKTDLQEKQQIYELDEMYTFIGNKGHPCYIIYAINRQTRKVVEFTTGSRTKENIGLLVRKLLSLFPKRIYTDRLPVYKSLIPEHLHKILPYQTNRIERKNLTIRTHLKRLSRKTICFSKSETMLRSCFELYVSQRE
jgi:insertion element IS1 protein InsB